MTVCRRSLSLAAFLLLVCSPLCAAQEAERGFLNRTIKDPDGTEAKYVVFVPHDYKGDKPYPLILFLHGAGGTGTDGERPAKVGLGPALKKQEKTFSF